MSPDNVKQNLQAIAVPLPRNDGVLTKLNPHHLILWGAWHHGLMGGTILQETSDVLTTFGGIGLFASVADLMDRLPKGWILPLPAEAGVFVFATATLGGWMTSQYIRQESKKLSEYLKKDFDLYTDSLLGAYNVDKASQAYLLGRAIHDLGYRLASYIQREDTEEEEARVHSCDRRTLTEDEFKEIGRCYNKFNKLITLATEAGLLKPGGRSDQHIKRHFLRAIQSGVSRLAKGSEQRRTVFDNYNVVALDYLAKQQAEVGATGMHLPIRSLRKLRRLELKAA